MKRKITLSVLILMLIFAFSFSAFSVSFKDEGIKYKAPDGYEVITRDNFSDSSEIINQLGYTISTISDYFNKNGILMLAVNEDFSKQIQIKCTETDFTLQTDNITSLDEKSAVEIASKMLGVGKEKFKLVLINDVRYIETRSIMDSGDNKYAVIQYITIANGKLYTLSYYSNSASVTQSVVSEGWSAASKLEISKLDKKIGESVDNTITVVVITLSVLFACAVIVYVFITFFFDIKKKRESSTEGIIKRRHKK